MRIHNSFLFLLATCLYLTGCKTASNEDIVNLPRESYEKGGVSFSLAKVEGFYTVFPDSVGWSGYMPQTEDNGQILYLFMENQPVELASPQVRVEYIAKSLQNCGTVKEMQDWLKGVFINSERQGEIIGGEPLKTLDGQDVEVLEIFVPETQVSDTLRRTGKRMAWAYTEDGDRWVGFNFSAVDSGEYAKGMPLFRKVVRSYKAD